MTTITTTTALTHLLATFGGLGFEATPVNENWSLQTESGVSAARAEVAKFATIAAVSGHGDGPMTTAEVLALDATARLTAELAEAGPAFTLASEQGRNWRNAARAALAEDHPGLRAQRWACIGLREGRD